MVGEMPSIGIPKSELSRPCPFKSGSHNGACTPLCPLWDKARRACEIRMAREALVGIADSLTRMSLQRQEMDLISERVEDLTGRVNDLPAAPELSENLDGQLDSIRVRLSAHNMNFGGHSSRMDSLSDLITKLEEKVDYLDKRMAQKVDVPETDDRDNKILAMASMLAHNAQELIGLVGRSNAHDD